MWAKVHREFESPRLRHLPEEKPVTFTSDELRSMDPVEYAKVRNQETNSRAKREGWTFWTLIPEDREFFENRGVKTAYDYELQVSKLVLSDTFKEVNGFRPRGIYPLDTMDLEAVEKEIEKLSLRSSVG